MFLVYNVDNMIGVFGSRFKADNPSEASIITFTAFDSIVTGLTVMGILCTVNT
jgi:hypothetical protein